MLYARGRTFSDNIVLDPGHFTTINKTGCVVENFVEAEFVHGVVDYCGSMIGTINAHPEPEYHSYRRRMEALIKSGVESPLALIHVHVDACAAPSARGTWAIASLHESSRELGVLLTSAQHAPRPEQTLRPPVKSLYSPIAQRALKLMQAYSGDITGGRGMLHPYAHVLVELGFATNNDDRAFFLSEDGMEQTARKLCDAILAWKETVK